MSQTHDLIHSLEHEPEVRRRTTLRRNQSPQLVASPAEDGSFADGDFDDIQITDEEITGLTSEQTKQILREVIKCQE